MKETFLEAIDHLLSIIDKYNIKNIGPQVDELHILKEYVNTNREMVSIYGEMVILFIMLMRREELPLSV